jgi:hypothetical protein
MTFTENESYKHKLAKELLSKWLKEKNDKVKWHGDGVHLEYPLIQSMRQINFCNIVGYGYDLGDGNREYYANNTNNFNPTYIQCVENNDIPLAVLDIAIVYKGCIFEGFEVYHTNKVNNDKKEKIKKLTHDIDFKLYEISAEKILCQTKIPEDIYKLCDRII